MDSWIIKGDLCFSRTQKELCCIENGFLVCRNGKFAGAFSELPQQYRKLPVYDYTGKLVFPGMTDLHIHAPQFAFRGTGMDLELLDWLNRITFPEEAKYLDEDYASLAYGQFADSMRRSVTTRAVIFATRHRRATEILMDKMEQTGIVSYVGKINMDRFSIPELDEDGYLDSAYNTFGWINGIRQKYARTYPILTPRFIPSCSDELMNELSELQKTYGLPVQSHLSENKSEIEWVRELCPWSKFYGDAYARWGLFGGSVKTVMAHCVYSTDEEVELMRKNGVFVAHCPASNVNLSSGIAPIRRYMDLGMRVGLGSDVAGGHTPSMLRAVTDTVQVSKLYWRLIDDSARPISFEEAFYLATVGGGEFFGSVGSFCADQEADCIVLDDSSEPSPEKLPIAKRMERASYLGLDRGGVLAKFVCGRPVPV